MRSSAVIGILIIICIFSIGSASAYQYTVYANNPSGITTPFYAFAGETIRFTYISGLWTIGEAGNSDANGYAGDTSAFESNDGYHQSLIGSTDGGATWFSIRNYNNITITTTGYLILNANDAPNAYANNGGSIVTNVEVSFNSTNAITFSNTTDWNQSVSSEPINTTFYINVWINGSPTTDIIGQYHLKVFAPNGDLLVESKPVQQFYSGSYPIQYYTIVPSTFDYGIYKYSLIDFVNAIELVNASLLIYNASSPNDINNPGCILNCNPINITPPCDSCVNPGFETAHMLVSLDAAGSVVVSSIQTSTTVDVQFTHINGNSSHSYNISWYYPNGTLAFNATGGVPWNMLSGYVPWMTPNIPGIWSMKFSDNLGNVLGHTTLDITPPNTFNNTSYISGYVRDSGNGKGINNAGVSLLGINGTTGFTNTYTDKWGYYLFPLVVSGKYRMVASQTGYSTQSRDVNISNNTNQNFYLSCLTTCANFSINVAISTKPVIPNATVELFMNNAYIYTFYGTEYFSAVPGDKIYLIATTTSTYTDIYTTYNDSSISWTTPITAIGNNDAGWIVGSNSGMYPSGTGNELIEVVFSLPGNVTATPTPGFTPPPPSNEDNGVILFDWLLAFIISYIIWICWWLLGKVL